MTSEETLLIDSPPYDHEFIKVIAFACLFVMAPVFIMIFLFEPEWGYWGLVLGVLVPIFVAAIPYLLVVPTKIVVSSSQVRIKHGRLWTIRIPIERIVHSEVLDHPPWWGNFQYFFPHAQWVYLRKSSGILHWWYVPTTSATRLVLSIMQAQERGRP